jgi:heme-binding protein
MPKFNTRATRGAAVVIGGLAAATIAAPTSQAAPDCTASGVAGTVSTTTAAAQSYLANHPDANQAVTAAMNQPRPVASANLRSYFTGHPQQYNDLRGIAQPLSNMRTSCNTNVTGSQLSALLQAFTA